MKLHIGCGKNVLPGFKQLDVIPYKNVDFVCNARDLGQFSDESIEEIYASHVLEHFKRSETVNVLLEWNRVLAKGGTIRLAVPDFAAIVAEYTTSKTLDGCQGLLFGGQTYDFNFHHMAFDFALLQKFLQDANFTNIELYDWRDFLPADYDDYSRAYLPHMDFANGRAMSLNVIAVKPP